MEKPKFEHGSDVLLEIFKSQSANRLTVIGISTIFQIGAATFSVFFGFKDVLEFVGFTILVTSVFLWSFQLRIRLADQMNGIIEAVVRLDSEFVEYYVQWSHENAKRFGYIKSFRFGDTVIQMVLAITSISFGLISVFGSGGDMPIGTFP